ncbi:EamA family transporter [Candidatus Babeliales bacterium]|nr:EamA family transporter [Candidatus Babeliales bacterium]
MMQIMLLYALYAVVFIFAKQALLFSKPVFLTGARMMTAGVCSYLLHRLWYNRVSFRSISMNDAWYIFLLAVFNVYLTNANEAWSLQYLSAGKVAFIYNLSPFFSLFFSWWMFNEKITWKKILGMVIACASISPLLMENGFEEIIDTTWRLGFLSVAEIVMIIASAATALGWVLMKYLMDQRSDFNSYFLNGISLTMGGMMCFFQSFKLETEPYILPGHFYDFLGYMLLMMILQNLIAYNFNAYLLKIHSATLVILFSFVMPIITALLGYFMLSEPLTWEFFGCSIGVAIGLLIFYQQELAEERHSHHKI